MVSILICVYRSTANSYFRPYWLGSSLGNLQFVNSIEGYLHHNLGNMDV